MLKAINNFIADFKTDLISRASAIKNDTSARRIFVRNSAFFIMISALLLCAVTLTCAPTEGAVNAFMSIVVPIFMCVAGIIVYCEFFKSNSYFTMLLLFLLILGAALQTVLKFEDVAHEEIANVNVTELCLFLAVSLVVALVAVPVLSFLCQEKPNRYVYLTLFGSVAMYLLLIALGTRVNGTLAWINIAGISIQITEITRFLGILSLVAMFTSNVNPIKKLVGTAMVLLIHAAFLMFCNELGTLMVLAAVYFVLALIRLPKAEIKKLVAAMLVCAMLGLAVLVACGTCYNTVYGGETTQEEKTEEDATIEQATTEQAEESKKTLTLKELEEKHGKYTVLFANLYAKVYNRIQGWLHPEQFDPYGMGYQANQAQNALAVSGALGSEFQQHIPVKESDFIFIVLVQRQGVIIAALVVLAFVGAYLIASPKILKNKYGSEGVTAFALLTSMTIQSFINIGMVLNLLPIVGLPLPFLSNGGSSMVLNVTTMLFAIYSMRDTNKEVQKNEKRI